MTRSTVTDGRGKSPGRYSSRKRSSSRDFTALVMRSEHRTRQKEYLSLPGSRNPVFVEAPEERAPGNPELAGRARLISAAALEDIQDLRALGRIDRLVRGRQHVRHLRGQSKVHGLDRQAQRKDRRALHDVPQLTN